MLKALTAAILLVFATATASAAPKTYKLDPEHTIVAFLVDHIGFAKMLGRFNAVSGSFVYDEETQTLSDLRVVVETASVDTNHKRRDDHVRSKDFLHVEKYPQMTFEADGGVPEGPNRGTVPGRLTLLGQTKPLTLDVTLNKSEVYPFGHSRHTLGISARAAVNRSEYGMTYGVAAGMVGDVVNIIIEIEAIRQD
jgi:polyisoprenoid-binding protein YceI